jgi:UDP-N-acetylmuramoyl-L-alanyl-D-glutamate--2,6-diaminopimelate ligase
MISGIVYIQVADSRHAIGAIAQNFYDHPSKKLKLVGVTGTNGKTTTATLLFEIFRFLGHHTALISTVENKIDDIAYPTTHTTPTPLNLTKFLAQAVEVGAEYAFMECSSHGIEEERIAGLEFTGALFTNLTQDHLDFHGTLQKLY